MKQSMDDTGYQQIAQHTTSLDDKATASLSPEAAYTSQETLVRTWMSGRAQIAGLRDIILTKRIEVKRERSQRYIQEEQFERIMETYMDVLSTITPKGFDLQTRSTLNRISQELKSCKKDLETLRKRAATLEDALSRHEYELQRVEEHVYLDLDKQLKQSELSYRREIERNSTSAISPSGSNVDTRMGLRDRLYSRIGDVRIYLERLYNFEYDLREELEQRDLIRASGQVVTTTDYQFFEQTSAERTRIQQDLEQAQVEVEELKEKCLQNGIEFEEPTFAEDHGQTETDSFATIFEDSTYQPEEAQGSSSIIGAFYSAHERVMRWLKEPTGPGHPEKEGAESIPEEMRQSSSSDIVWVPAAKRPASIGTAGKYGSAVNDAPRWRYGPRPGSSLLEALLLDSASTPLAGYSHLPGSSIAIGARQSLPDSRSLTRINDASRK